LHFGGCIGQYVSERYCANEYFCESAVSVSGDRDGSLIPTKVKERIRAMALSDDVSNNDSIDDGTG
jgi:hypothetical protein